MADEEEWARQIAEWRASGLTAKEFCAGCDFTVTALYGQSSRRGRARDASRGGQVRLGRVRLRPRGASKTEDVDREPPVVMLEVEGGRVFVTAGVERATLCTVLGALEERASGAGGMTPSGVEVFVGVAPIDLRWGFDRLAGVAEERMGPKARGGVLFVFFGKRLGISWKAGKRPVCSEPRVDLAAHRADVLARDNAAVAWLGDVLVHVHFQPSQLGSDGREMFKAQRRVLSDAQSLILDVSEAKLRRRQ